MLCFPFALTEKNQPELGDGGDEGRLLPSSSSSPKHIDEAEEDSEDFFEEGEAVEDLLEEEEQLQPQPQEQEQSTLLRTELKEHEDMDRLLEPFLREDAEHCDPALSTFLGVVSLSHLLLFVLAIVASLSFGWAPITVELSAPCSSPSSSHDCTATTTATENSSGNPNLFAIQRPSSAALLHLASFFRCFATQRFASSSFFQFMQSYAYFQPPLSSGAAPASSSASSSLPSSSSVDHLLLDELNYSNRNHELFAFGGMCSFLVGAFLGLIASLITLSPFKQQLFRAISLVNIIAALTYLSIYLRLSPILLDNLGRPLLIGHHLQWCCTTPILLVLMGKVALLPIRRRVEVVCWDLVMLVSGLLGAVMPVQTEDGEGLGWGIGMLVVSFVAFGFVLRDIWVLFGRSTRLNAFSPQGVSLLRFLTICLWCGFPVVVMLGSLEVLSADGVFMWLTVCDVTAKLLFAVALLHLNLLNAETKQVVQRGKRLTLYETALQTVRSVEEDNAILERGKLQAEAVAQLHRTFLANMSHELRTPLNSVIGFNELLLETKLAKRQRTWVNAAFTSAEALLGVIDNILEFSKFETDRIQLENAPFELAHTLRDLSSIVSPFATKKGIRFSISCPPGFPTLLGDAFRLRQILINLVNNATKFAEKGGEVTLHISHLKSQPIPNSSTTTSPSPAFLHTLQFHVRDTGIGIPVSKMHFLCKPFSQVQQSNTRRFGGSGLGLVIAQKLAFAMGGSMWVNSVLSEGTIFSFTGCFQSSEEFGTLEQQSAATNDELPFTDTEIESAMQQPENEKEKENEEEKVARKQRKLALRRKSLKGLRVLLLVESVVASRWLQALLRTWGAKSSAVISFFEGGKPSKLRWLFSSSASASSPLTSSPPTSSSSTPSSFSSFFNKLTPTTTRKSMNEEEKERREDEEYDVVIMDHTLFSYYLFNADKNVEELLSRFSKARFFSIMQLLDKLEFQEKHLFPSTTRPRSSSLSGSSTAPSFMQQQEKGDNENVQIGTSSKEGGNKRRRRRQKKRTLSTIGEENETEESKEKEERQLLMYKTKVVELCGMKPVRETFLYETLRKEWKAKEQRRGSNDVAEDGPNQHRRRTSSTCEEQTPPKTISEQKGLQQQKREQKQQNAASKQRGMQNEQKTEAQKRPQKRSHNSDGDGKTIEKTNGLKRLQKGSSNRIGKQSKAEESDEEEESEELPEYELEDDEDRYNVAQEGEDDDEVDEDETYDEEDEEAEEISKLTDIEKRISQQQTTSSIERHHHLMLPINPTSGTVTGRRKLIGLVVEDNPLNQKVVSAILRKLGVVFDIACNGIEALVRLTTAKVIYDVIFMDVQVWLLLFVFFLSFHSKDNL
ncbi:Enoyl-[acyl-carrier-protein] reductase [NADPH, B-specific] 2, mitochondrial [Balamuthia mandrillaris]